MKVQQALAPLHRGQALASCLVRAATRAMFTREQTAVLHAQVEAFEQVWTARTCAQEPLPPAPPGDRAMIAAQQDCRNSRTIDDFRPGVMRTIEQTVDKRVLYRRQGVAER